jgi:hypothetical protein
MRLNIFFIVVAIISSVISFITILYLNKFLFFIHGYDSNLLKSTSVEAFDAYRSIYKARLIFLISAFILSTITFFWAKNLQNKSPFLIYKISMWVLGFLIILLTIALILFFILPKDVV